MAKGLGWAVLGVSLLCGCAEPVLGTWDLDEKGVDSSLELKEDGRGEEVTKLRFDATCDDGYEYWEGQALLKVTSKIEWKELGDVYRLEWDCKSASISGPGDCHVSGCDDVAEVLGITFDSRADCTLEHDDNDLDCETKDGGDLTYTR